jgi:hypothetical protein
MKKFWQVAAVAFIIALMVFSATLYVLPREMNIKPLQLNTQYLQIRKSAIKNGTPENLSGIELFYSYNVSVIGIGNFQFALIPAFSSVPPEIINTSSIGRTPIFIPPPVVNFLLTNESSNYAANSIEFKIMNISVSSRNYSIENITSPYGASPRSNGGVYGKYIGPSYLLDAYLSGAVPIQSIPVGNYTLAVTIAIYQNIIGFPPPLLKIASFSMPFIDIEN